MKNILPIALVAGVLVVGYFVFKPNVVKDATSVTPTPSLSAVVSPTTKPRIIPKVSAMPTLSMTPTPTSTLMPSPTMMPTASPSLSPTISPTPTPTPTALVSQTFHVDIVNHTFSSTPLTVHQGDRVVFKNLDPSVHTVTALNLQFNSGNLHNGEEWTLMTDTRAPGTYEYRCTIHPSMRGTLIIQ